MQSPETLMLLHGWAANHHVFDPLIELLPDTWHTIAPDLPGHGSATFDGSFNPIAIADAIADTISQPIHLLGWSLGGLIAIYIASRHPDKVISLTLTASFAKFKATPDYPAGLTNPALDKMADLFQRDYNKYIEQFFQLQFLYAKDQATMLDSVLPQITSYGTPPALTTALEAISDADARQELSHIDLPVWLAYGAKDTITPPRMGHYLSEQLPHAEITIFERSSHAPFLTERDHFAQLLVQFIHQHSAFQTA